MGVLALAIAERFGPTLAGLGYFLCTAALVSLAYIDLDTWLLPSEITLPLLGAGLLSPLWNQALAIPLAGFLPGWRPLAIAFLSSAGGALAGGSSSPPSPSSASASAASGWAGATSGCWRGSAPGWACPRCCR